MMSLARGFAFNLYLLSLTLVMGLAALPIRLAARFSAPSSSRPDLALAYAKLWARAVLWGLTTLCGVRIVVKGREHLPEGAAIIASQHQSFFDGFIWMTLVPRPTYVIKEELARLPFVGPMLLLSGMIPVDRQGGAQALRDMMSATSKALASKRQIVLFPEGTRTLPGQRAPLQAGLVAVARQAKDAPILPVVTNSGRFWPRSPWRKYPGVLEVVIGPPLPPASGRALLGNLEQSWDQLCAASSLPRAAVASSP